MNFTDQCKVSTEEWFQWAEQIIYLGHGLVRHSKVLFGFARDPVRDPNSVVASDEFLVKEALNFNAWQLAYSGFVVLTSVLAEEYVFAEIGKAGFVLLLQFLFRDKHAQVVEVY